MTIDNRIRFENDYSETAHPAVIARLAAEGGISRPGYGLDDACVTAADYIRHHIKRDSTEVHFLIGGTSANLIAHAAFLRPHEAVICAEAAHINVHEAGAVEASGHKMISVQSDDGKLRPDNIRTACLKHSDESMVHPRMVFISNATELGTHYTLSELRLLKDVCKQLNLLLYMDGARLGSALAVSDIQWSDLPNLLDAFYIGGTKNGAMFGEAMVIVNDTLKPYFRTVMKQRGGMLAKGFLLGAQFQALFEGGLYMEIAKHANAAADKMRAALTQKNVAFKPATETNQIFAVMPNDMIGALHTKYAFHIMEPVGGRHSVVRLVTSWATTNGMVEEFTHDLSSL